MSTESMASNHQIRLAHLRAIEARGINAFPAQPYPISHTAEYLNSHYDSLKGDIVSVAGRLTSVRDHNKLVFDDITDATGKIQTVLTPKRLGDEFDFIRDNFDVGDFIGVTGTLEATRIGTPSIWVEEATMLTKALRETPFKIGDQETMQRQRYLELLSDPKARDRFRTRSAIVQYMRNYFIDTVGSMEVETPILDTTYGGASAKPFTTHHNALDSQLYMRIAPELYLKRLTPSFQEGVFEFSRNFRNEGMDRTHNPEFTTVELYKPYWDYNNMMDMTEDMISGMVQKIHGSSFLDYGEMIVDYGKPWSKLSIYDGLKMKLGFDAKKDSDDDLRRLAQKHLRLSPITELPKYDNLLDRCQARLGSLPNRGQLLVDLFEKVWEKDLINPTFVTDYPAETSPLTKRHRNDPDLAERFELYVGGMEVGNCYTELNDPRDQRDRFLDEAKKRTNGDDEAMLTDEDFLTFQEYGMPQQAGIGLSIDRFTMLLTNTDHIRQSILFPTLRRK